MINELYIYLLYLFYGLAFFTMGAAITSRDTSFSNLKIVRYLWLFALFAYTHAFHEWSEFLFFFQADMPADFFTVFYTSKLALVFISYLFLLKFGVQVLGIVDFGKHYFALLPFVLSLLWVLLLVRYGLKMTPDFYDFADQWMRYLIGFPAGFLAGLGCILYSRSIRYVSGKGAANFIGAGVMLMIYGLLTGIIHSGTVLPVLQVRVELLRGLSAFVILHFFMNALHIFDIERKAIIEDSLHRFAKSEKLTSMGKLAAGIAHEINNPLSNVYLNVERLKKELSFEPASVKFAKRFMAIERNLDRASKIARELLYFSREGEAEFMSVNLNEIAQRTADLLGDQKKEYLICYDFGSIPEIMGIPWKLEEVFLNVLMNAMEASPSGSVVTISTFQRDDEVVAAISDNGRGIAHKDFHYIFDPFFTTKEVGKGTGLGLSICYGIMKLHDGRLEVRSKPNFGTTVSLIFPEGGKQKDA
jgi:signal transduction histidine kinase